MATFLTPIGTYFIRKKTGVDIIVAPLIYQPGNSPQTTVPEASSSICDLCEIVYKSFTAQKLMNKPLPSEFKVMNYLEFRETRLYEMEGR